MPILVPVLVVFPMLVLLAAWHWRQKQQADQKRIAAEKKRLDAERAKLAAQKEVEQLRKTWQIDPSELQLKECIWRGAVGEVFRGRWRDMVVAVKTVRGICMTNEEMEKELDHEATTLQKVRHAHVVQFFGAGTLEDGTPFMVVELMELGTLRSMLHNAGTELDWPTRQRFVREAALGMALVHSLGHMHRDLKSDNILVSIVAGRMQIKVADFGTATLATLASASVARESMVPLSPAERVATTGRRTKRVGTPLWMAPEVLAGERTYGKSADVYSFGIVMWEVAARCYPWEEVQDADLLDALLCLITSGQRPAVDSEWPDGYVAVMRQCWATDPQNRPTFDQVAVQLKLEEVRLLAAVDFCASRSYGMIVLAW